MLWSTVGGLRSPSNLVSLQATPAGLVASPAVTGKSIQSLAFLYRADLLCIWDKVVICDSSGGILANRYMFDISDLTRYIVLF